ncbi:hypothetical protein NliqN6_0746 [Naganishia liquefaciens]|uniref:Sodium/calcium exchanger membrane region domain-containing protein n=1 Tax=Naganishia liquefaciens TaxID=104408 RepID=A0A8H3TNY8_9TREE|nr:hypothetical protein NliqN6_0746 [Naganishia liquefaciens]
MATRRRAWLALVLFSLVLQVLLWRSAARIDARAAPGIRRRADPDDDRPGTLLNIDYSEWYFDSHKAQRPFRFVALVLWAGFLFSTIGITASDFFCPNLATVADRLGLSESTAGVTFLAFGNGSPDVFSTFSALKSDSFALAIGELLGASAFITSIVVGSMALVQPFHVPRWPFLRDVGFFTCAVMILVACLRDGKLTLPETGGLVGMYVLYVGIVVGGNWWATRRRQREEQGKMQAQVEDYFSQPGSVESQRPSAITATPTMTLEQAQLLKPADALRGGRSRSVSNASRASASDISPLATPLPLSRRSSNGTLALLNAATATSRPQIDQSRPAFSLIGAIEFRDAINALRKESAAAAAAESGRQLVDAGQLSGQLDDLLGEPSFVTDYFGGASPYPSGHYHSLHGHGHHHARTSASGARSPSRPAHSRQVSSSFRLPETEAGLLAKRLEPARIESSPVVPGGKLQVSVHDVRRASADAIRDLGRGEDASVREQTTSAASLHDVEPDSIPLLASGPSASPKPLNPPTWVHTCRHILHILFPALEGFREKSISGKILGIFASPAILALTLTLPVVDDAAEGVALNQGGIALGDDEPEPERDERFTAQTEAEAGVIVHHTDDAEREDSQRVMGQAGRDLHRRVLNPGDAGTPKEDKDPSETCSEGSEDEVLLFNKYLTAVQSVLGTLFCSCVMFSENTAGKYIIPLSTAAGLILAVAIIITARDGMDPTWRLIRCFAGFFSAMLWIAAIADEVVEILQTFGKILGLSNAIIGLTVFAVGNSCADLISCLTIASFAPNMSYAACFGGPMLNILLGIGGAGTYVILSTGHSYPVHFSPTLWVSAIGLICLLCITLVFVPFNNYCISRKWAIFLYSFYISLTAVNVLVEVKGIRI